MHVDVKPAKKRIGAVPLLVGAALLILAGGVGATPWGAGYFPNVPLVTQNGETVHFFDDVIKNKIVAINFIYTTCADTCPLETAHLTKVQKILGDRVGKDVFFYSISIDPEHDTPEVLKDYAQLFKANWTFLTGEEQDIILLRKKLGLYLEDIQDGSLNHNVSMIIGNQATGRWMKRSPFENPYVLAEQLGSWLTGWKNPPRGGDYADAPALRTISDGERLFRTRCEVCHSVDGSNPDGIGPDLLGVTRVREHNWLVSWLRAPDEMIASGDPIALALYEQYNGLAMPNMRLSQVDVADLMEFMDAETDRQQLLATDAAPPILKTGIQRDVVAVANARIRRSNPGENTTAGYLTLVNLSDESEQLIGIRSAAFGKIEVHEMAVVRDLPRMREVELLELPAGGRLELAPGGKHLMLFRPVAPLVARQQVSLTLVFASGAEQTVLATVLEPDQLLLGGGK